MLRGSTGIVFDAVTCDAVHSLAAAEAASPAAILQARLDGSGAAAAPGRRAQCGPARLAGRCGSGVPCSCAAAAAAAALGAGPARASRRPAPTWPCLTTTPPVAVCSQEVAAAGCRRGAAAGGSLETAELSCLSLGRGGGRRSDLATILGGGLGLGAWRSPPGGGGLAGGGRGLGRDGGGRGMGRDGGDGVGAFGGGDLTGGGRGLGCGGEGLGAFGGGAFCGGAFCGGAFCGGAFGGGAFGGGDLASTIAGAPGGLRVAGHARVRSG
jgi:heterogeneous nuclear ribonucleoprotein A1/A3